MESNKEAKGRDASPTGPEENEGIELPISRTSQYDLLTQSDTTVVAPETGKGEDIEQGVCASLPHPPVGWGRTLATNLDEVQEQTFHILRQDPDTGEYLVDDEDQVGLDDERYQIGQTDRWPYQCVGRFLVTHADGRNYLGSGVLISSNCVLTCAHNVFNYKRGGWARRLVFFPGQNGQLIPFGKCVATRLFAPEQYTSDIDPPRAYDFAVVALSHNYGNELGWWGYSAQPDDYFKERIFEVLGYPGDKGGRTLWVCAGNVDVKKEILTYNELDTDNGQSGGPLTVSGAPYVVGVHITGSPTHNSAVRITEEKCAQITEWVTSSTP